MADLELSPDRARAMLAAGTPCRECGSNGATIASHFRFDDDEHWAEYRVVCSQCNAVGYAERTSSPPPRDVAPSGKA